MSQADCGESGGGWGRVELYFAYSSDCSWCTWPVCPSIHSTDWFLERSDCLACNTHLVCRTGRLHPVVEAMAPLQSTRKRAWGGEKVEPRRMPITSALYELGLPGMRHRTMRPSGSTAEAPEAGGDPKRLPSV